MIKNNKEDISKNQALRILKKAINSFTYGVNCFLYQPSHKAIYQCCMNIHQQYINILHLIVEKSSSYLIHLEQLKTITDQDSFIESKLAKQGLEYFIVVHTSSRNIVFATYTQYQKTVIWQGLLFFRRQAQNFYKKITQLDPFKAESAMIFLSADMDGGNIMDMNQLTNILKQLRINKTKQEILSDVNQINQELYQKDNLRKPSGFTYNQLTPQGFQNLLRYYLLKVQASKQFQKYCPLFKLRKRSHKNSIMQILKNNQNPLMSSYQLSIFFLQSQKVQISEQDCQRLVKSFPTYDGYGRQKQQQNSLLCFNSFCNLLYSAQNDIMNPQKYKFQNMNLPLSDYFIYSSNKSYLQYEPDGSLISHIPSSLQRLLFILKKGCRHFQIDVYDGTNKNIHVGQKNPILLEQVLKSIRKVGFQISSYPIILTVQNNCSQNFQQLLANTIQQLLGEILYTAIPEIVQALPSPDNLQGKIIILGGLTGKYKDKQNEQKFKKFNKLVALNRIKLDFQRKGHTIWNVCQIPSKRFNQYQDFQRANMQSYSRKIIIKTVPSSFNYDPIAMIRMGVQLICQNFQTIDINNFILHSLFTEHKMSGYISKPKWMQLFCQQSLYLKEFQRPSYDLKITVLEGQKCFIDEDEELKQFYLEVFIKGTKFEQKANKKYKSQLKTEAFFTTFNIECQFKIYCPQVCMLIFSITDGKSILSARAIRIDSMREGLRSVKLLNKNLQYGLNSYLLINCAKKQILKNKQFTI